MSNGRPRPRPGSAAAGGRPQLGTTPHADTSGVARRSGGAGSGGTASALAVASSPSSRHGAASAGRTRTAPAAAVITATKAPGAKLVSVGSSMTLRLGDRHGPTLPPRQEGTLARGASKEGWRPPVARDLVGVMPWEMHSMPKLFADVIVAEPKPPPQPLPKVSPREVRDERRFVTEAGLHGSTRIACGWRHCIAVSAAGEVCAWGSNSHGQLGVGAAVLHFPTIASLLEGQRAYAADPARAPPIGSLFPITGVGSAGPALSTAAGATVAAVPPASVSVGPWDPSVGSMESAPGPGPAAFYPSPVRVAALCETRVAQVACGALHTLVLSQDGVLYAFGANGCGQLGIGLSEVRSVGHPTMVPGLTRVKRVAAGALHSLATMESQQLFSWGSNRCGQLGHLERALEWAPRVVAALLVKPTVAAPAPPTDPSLRPHVPVIEAVGGRAHSLVLSKSGSVFSFGSNDCGQLGQPKAPAYGWPLGLVEDLRHRRVVQVAAGGGHSMALDVLGQVFAWGCNGANQLGCGDGESPEGVVSPIGLIGSPVARIACGEEHSAAVTFVGEVYVWGHGYALGRGVQNDHRFSMLPDRHHPTLDALLPAHAVPSLSEPAVLEPGTAEGSDQPVPLAAPVERELRAAVRAHVHRGAIAVRADSTATRTRPVSGRAGSGGSTRPLSAAGRGAPSVAPLTLEDVVPGSAKRAGTSVGRRRAAAASSQATQGSDPPPLAIAAVTHWIHELCAGGACAIVAGPEGSMVEIGPGARDPVLHGPPNPVVEGEAGIAPDACLPITRIVI